MVPMPAGKMQRRILVVEDEREIASLVARLLRDAGFAAAVEHSGPPGLARAEAEQFDLLVLDVGLPGIDGLEVCRRLRARHCRLPILMLSARASEGDRVCGFEAGADDYLGKPFGAAELLARIKALLRRVEAADPGGNVIQVGGLRMDLARHEVVLAGRPVTLTAKEFLLLAVLARQPGRIFTRAQLLDAVWGVDHDGYDHTVHSHINRLRSKIEKDPAKPQRVLTVRSVGYKLHAPAFSVCLFDAELQNA